MNFDKQKVLNAFDRTIKKQVEKFRVLFESYDELFDVSPTEKNCGESIAIFAIYSVLENFQRSETIEEIRRRIIEEED